MNEVCVLSFKIAKLIFSLDDFKFEFAPKHMQFSVTEMVKKEIVSVM